MLKCDLRALLDENKVSKYSLVVACAKRAREISDHAVENKIEILEKPVTLAIDEFFAGKYKIVEESTEELAEVE